MNLAYLNHSAREIRHEGASLPDWYIRKVCGSPPTGPRAVAQAQYSAHALEQDRENTRARK
jgi:hypothetical protein